MDVSQWIWKKKWAKKIVGMQSSNILAAISTLIKLLTFLDRQSCFMFWHFSAIDIAGVIFDEDVTQSPKLNNTWPIALLEIWQSSDSFHRHIQRLSYRLQIK